MFILLCMYQGGKARTLNFRDYAIYPAKGTICLLHVKDAHNSTQGFLPFLIEFWSIYGPISHKNVTFHTHVKSNAPCAVPHMLTKSFSVNSEKIINETCKIK